MPVQIGESSASFADPTRLLSDCHRRIEMFLRVLLRVAEKADHPLDSETRVSLETALRYFREAAPKHTADEEESLFPRLRRFEDTAAKLALSRLDLLETDHRNVAPLHEEVEKLGMQYLETGLLQSSQVKEFREAINKLGRIYSQHITVEDDVVFPLAAKLLSAADKRAVGSEMANRRKIRPIQIELPQISA